MYNEFEIYGPYQGKDNRLRCVLVHKITKRKRTVSYPKFLFETHHQRFVKDGFEIHHKDENPLNNDITNLEEIEKKTHVKNHGLQQDNKYEKIKIFKCLFCKKDFSMNRNKQRNFNHNQKQGKTGPFCSKSCSGKHSRFLQIDNGQISLR